MNFYQLKKKIEKIQKGKLNGYAIRLSSKEKDLYAEGDHSYPLSHCTLIVDKKSGKFNKSLGENMYNDANSKQVITALYIETDDQLQSIFLMEQPENASDDTNKTYWNFINGQTSPIEDLNFICLFWRYGKDSSLLIIHQDQNKNVQFSSLRSNNIRLTTILYNLTQAFSSSNGVLLDNFL